MNEEKNAEKSDSTKGYAVRSVIYLILALLLSYYFVFVALIASLIGKFKSSKENTSNFYFLIIINFILQLLFIFNFSNQFYYNIIYPLSLTLVIDGMIIFIITRSFQSKNKQKHKPLPQCETLYELLNQCITDDCCSEDVFTFMGKYYKRQDFINLKIKSLEYADEDYLLRFLNEYKKQLNIANESNKEVLLAEIEAINTLLNKNFNHTIHKITENDFENDKNTINNSQAEINNNSNNESIPHCDTSEESQIKQMKFCRYCGKELGEGNFCQYCGKKVR